MRFINAMANGFQRELRKIASEKKGSVSQLLSNPLAKPALYAALGVTGWKGIGKAHRDWKLGRQVRKSSGGRI